MTLYSGADCPLSHRVRTVLYEKNVAVEITYVSEHDLPEDLIDLNPYNTVPTLVDRDLVLYDSRIIMEYLDERYPHPPLMPVDPVARAQTRLMLHRIEMDWYSVLPDIISSDQVVADKARKVLQEGLMVIAPLFAKKSFFMNDDYTLVDSSVAPLLWRLKSYKIELPAQAKPLLEYGERLFKRDSFQAGLTDSEREMRAA